MTQVAQADTPAEYTVADVSNLAGLSAGQIRAYAQAGLVRPQPGPSGELRFSFQDLVFLRTAKRLSSARLPRGRVKRTLKKLLERWSDRPLSSLQLDATGNEVFVRDGAKLWDPETGQCLFDFACEPIGADIASLDTRRAEHTAQEGPATAAGLRSEDWYQLGCDLEDTSPDRALGAYRRALQLDPVHLGARLNMGRLFHELGDLETAESHYRQALAVHPDDPTATFNLAVALEDRGHLQEAIALYETTIHLDPLCADAYYNLARLCEQLGDPATALRHLKAYRRLLQDR